MVIPTYNEAANVQAMLRALTGALEGREHRLLIVDDSSPDGTADLAHALTADGVCVEVLRRDVKDGLGRAYLAGFRHALAAGAERVAQMDCDFSHSPEDLVALVKASERGAPLVIGSRYAPGGATSDWSRRRLLLSRVASAGTRIILPSGIVDCWGGFKAWDARALAAIDLDAVRSAGFSFQAEMNFLARRAGFTAVEVPITFHERRAGTSKMRAGLVLEGLRLLPAVRLAHRAR